MITTKHTIKPEADKYRALKKTIGAGIAVSLTVLALKCDMTKEYVNTRNRFVQLEQQMQSMQEELSSSYIRWAKPCLRVIDQDIVEVYACGGQNQ